MAIPDTGQTYSKTNTFGEDSDYSINLPLYMDHGNGTVTDNGKFSPAIDITYFPDTYGDYWSSNTHTNYYGSAWRIRFEDGFITTQTKINNCYVRCVSGG